MRWERLLRWSDRIVESGGWRVFMILLLLTVLHLLVESP
jgi:hypothetical protein